MLGRARLTRTAFLVYAPLALGITAELSRGQRPLAPPVEAELRITDQYFGAAKERDPSINTGGYPGGTGQLGIDIISHAVLRIIKPAVCPMVLGARLQTPDNRETAEVPLP